MLSAVIVQELLQVELLKHLCAWFEALLEDRILQQVAVPDLDGSNRVSEVQVVFDDLHQDLDELGAGRVVGQLQFALDLNVLFVE